MKTFTIEEANRTLPLVSRIVEDIVHKFIPWRDLVREYELMKGAETIAHPDPRADSLERDVQTLAGEIDGYLTELAELGIECKDPALGLVDFPGEVDGRRIYLCWRLGEPAVEYWHELHTGYAGRRKITTAIVGRQLSVVSQQSAGGPKLPDDGSDD